MTSVDIWLTPYGRSGQISGKKPKNRNCCAFHVLTKSLANKLTAIKTEKKKKKMLKAAKNNKETVMSCPQRYKMDKF